MYIIHSNTILISIHFSKSFTTISHSPPDVNPISNLAKNYIYETIFHFVTKQRFCTSLLLQPTILLGYTITIPESSFYPKAQRALESLVLLVKKLSFSVRLYQTTTSCVRTCTASSRFFLCARVYLFKKIAHFLCVRLEPGFKIHVTYWACGFIIPEYYYYIL